MRSTSAAVHTPGISAVPTAGYNIKSINKVACTYDYYAYKECKAAFPRGITRIPNIEGYHKPKLPISGDDLFRVNGRHRPVQSIMMILYAISEASDQRR